MSSSFFSRITLVFLYQLAAVFHLMLLGWTGLIGSDIRTRIVVAIPTPCDLFNICVIYFLLFLVFETIRWVELIVDSILHVIVLVAVHHDPGVLPRLKSSESSGGCLVVDLAIGWLLSLTLPKLVVGIL